ncbi:MAG: hypothetical protein ACLU99_08630 [Alphaproteobacteria bacterium]
MKDGVQHMEILSLFGQIGSGGRISRSSFVLFVSCGVISGLALKDKTWSQKALIAVTGR